MRSRVLVALTFGLLPLTAAGQDKATVPSFISEVRVNNVTVNVQVTDAHGVPVDSLKKDDFRIFEDNAEQRVTNYFAVAGGEISQSQDAAVVGQPSPRTVLVFFDLYQLIESDKRLILNSFRDEVAVGLPPAETVAIVSFDGTVRVHTPPTNSRERLLAALKEVERTPATGLQHQITLSNFNVSPRSTYDYRSTLNEEYWNEMRRIVGKVETAFSASVDRFAKVEGRKVVILVSPGFPRAENVPSYRSFDFFRASVPIDYRNEGLLAHAAQLASELEFTLFTVDPSGIGAPTQDASRARVTNFNDVANARFWREADRKDNLIKAAQLTGGEAMFTTNGGAALADVERLTSSYYSLAFQPEHAGDGKEHTLRVEVIGHPDYHLSYRKSYVDRSAEQREAEQSRAALLTGQTDNPLGVELVLDKPVGKFKLGAQGLKVYRIGVEVRIPYAKLTMLPRGAKAWGEMLIVAVVSDAAGNLSELNHRKLPIEIPADKLDEARQRGYFAYRFPLEIEGGSHSLRIGVDDVLAHSTSAVIVDIKP
ncbi:MAG: VWA domain-containing protein [Thermoanaerobaculales bacterium]